MLTGASRPQVADIYQRIYAAYDTMAAKMMEVSEDVSSALDLERLIEASFHERETLERDLKVPPRPPPHP